MRSLGWLIALAGVCLVVSVPVCYVHGVGDEVDIGREARERLAPYAPVELGVPWDLIGEKDRAALEKLYQAAKVIDEIFLIQVWEGNAALREKLELQRDSDLLRFFRVNFGPWDRLAEDEPVLCDFEKPAGANFYPSDMAKRELEKWIKEHPEDRESFESTFTVIRRNDGGGLSAVPYSEEYGGLLRLAAAYLEEAAALTENESLSKFLSLRAKAFLSNDYFESDMAWMDVENNLLDVTIGPYEVYEDNLFGYKAAFEAFLCVRDPAESSKLDGLMGYILKMEKNLPIEDRYKNLDRGQHAPISVADEVFSAGDTKAGVQTLAFNLPNDERVQEVKGSKKVMLRNICRAKFDKILVPIAGRVLSPEQIPDFTFDAYFNHILLHEFSHGLGPGKITLGDGTETTVGKALRECNSAIEETKADVVGQYNFYYLIEDGFFPAELKKQTAVTYLAGFFRSVRFGVGSAHGRANMIAFNYFRKKGAYLYDTGTGLWSVDFDKIEGAVEDLSREILILQALGDYRGAKKFIEDYGEMGKEVKESLSRLEGIPVDIEPHFTIEEVFGAN